MKNESIQQDRLRQLKAWRDKRTSRSFTDQLEGEKDDKDIASVDKRSTMNTFQSTISSSDAWQRLVLESKSDPTQTQRH